MNLSVASIPIETTKIPKSLITSITLHVVIILALTVKAVFFQSENIVISNAMRVDIVALPDKIKPIVEAAPAPQPEPAPKQKKEEAKPKKNDKAVNIEKAQREQKKALESLKNELAREEQAKKEALDAIKKPESKTYKGNILAPGSEITGLAKIEYDKYFEQIRSAIKGRLVLPKWLKDANLKAHVLVKLDERGYVIFKKVSHSSGNEMYDNLVMDAVSSASPLPAPPARLVNVIMVDGVTLRFPDQ